MEAISVFQVFKLGSLFFCWFRWRIECYSKPKSHYNGHELHLSSFIANYKVKLTSLKNKKFPPTDLVTERESRTFVERPEMNEGFYKRVSYTGVLEADYHEGGSGVLSRKKIDVKWCFLRCISRFCYKYFIWGCRRGRERLYPYSRASTLPWMNVKKSPNRNISTDWRSEVGVWPHPTPPPSTICEYYF